MTEQDLELHARRAGSFGRQAGRYAEYRPGYPAETIDWMLPQGAADVLDLAAGTGKLTGSLVARGLNVTAVEPDEGMLAELEKTISPAAALTGTAEQIPLPDSSVDAVVVGQAFHWFDQHAALTEIGRVLRPGGVLGAVWNYEDDRVPWVSAFDEATRTDPSRSWRHPALFPDHPLFGSFERKDFPHSVRYTTESLIAMVGTHSHMLVATEEERERVARRMREFLNEHPETAAGEFDFPFKAMTYRGKRVVTT